jgi:protein tyrosine/serine phosphatase
MRRYAPYLLAALVAALIVGVPAGYSAYRQAHLRNFRVVQDGVLYRSGQLSAAGLQKVVREYGIRTVITLRDADQPGGQAPDHAEEAWCRSQGITYVRIPPRRWWAEEGPAPAEQNVATFLGVLDDAANHPVLIHCFAGVHRTGAHCAIFRMEYHRWDNAAAIAEMRHNGYDRLDEEPDVRGFIESYVPRWKRPGR